MSGYRDSMYWASDEEIAAYRDRQPTPSEPAREPASQQEPTYTPHRFVREGVRVFVDVQACKPVKIDGFDI